MRFFTSIIALSIVTISLAQKQTPKEYIEKYKKLAITEMHRSGVPASITLAQGILESNSGNSRLAKYANNHFGIKCKGSWTGNVIYANDDAPDECFRAYDSPLASFQDHSDFLRKNWRYHPLFELNREDYKGWCHGLRKAGYATNRQYGNILISLIEKYELNTFDLAPRPGADLPKLDTGEYVNGVPVKTVKPGETVSTIAAENFVKDKHIRKWNDLPAGTEVEAGDIVYLKPKRRRGSAGSHTVGKSDNMRAISQKYGIKLKQLYKKNRMEYGTEPKEGEVLNMQKKRASDDTVALAEKKTEWQEEKEEETPFVNPHSLPKKALDSTDFSNPGPLDVVQISVPEYHIVTKGDNVYRIAEKHHIFEEDIITWNSNLDPNRMRVGQKIFLKEQRSKIKKPAKDAELIPKPKSKKEIEEIKEQITVDGPVTHIVVMGDTLYNICKRFNVTEAQLKKWNGLSSITIKLGQKLQVSE